jgi:hypothetical protein
MRHAFLLCFESELYLKTVMPEVYNPNPTVYSLPSSSNRKAGKEKRRPRWIDEEDTEEETNEAEPIDSDEVFGASLVWKDRLLIHAIVRGADLIRSISDPEYPNTLEELRVVSAPQIKIGHNRVTVEFTPTVPHCGMSTLIGGYESAEIYMPADTPFTEVCVYVFDYSGVYPIASRLILSSSLAHIRASMLVRQDPRMQICR